MITLEGAGGVIDGEVWLDRTLSDKDDLRGGG